MKFLINLLLTSIHISPNDSNFVVQFAGIILNIKLSITYINVCMITMEV